MNTIFRQLSVFGWRRALLIILVIWFIVVVFSILPMIYNTNSNNNYETDTDQKLVNRLQQALINLDSVKKQNEELRKLLLDIAYSQLNGDQKELFENIKDKIQYTERILNKKHDFGLISSKDEPNPQYEKIRRRLQNNVDDLEFFLKSESNKFIKQVELLRSHNNNNNKQKVEIDLNALHYNLQRFRNYSLEQTRALSIDLINLAEVDGYQSWREKESERLSSLVQRRLETLQNPLDCKKAKKVLCNLNKGCGYGCQIHHVVYCLTIAYGTQRTLLLNSKGWRYNKAGWEDIFMPVSNSCTTYNPFSVGQWPGDNDPETIHLSIIDNLVPTPDYVPPAIPEDIAERLTRLHGDPIVWWIGQLLKYLLRPQANLVKLIHQATDNLNFQKPIVGIHVRRTDKIGTEASFHSLDEYMVHVNEYFDKLEQQQEQMEQHEHTVIKRRVYIASDDPKVIVLAKQKYPEYQVLGDTSIAKTAAVSTRYSERSLFGIILDIHFLSISDFIVCTFSSQVCRAAYEIMQTYSPDAYAQFRSLDDIHYYGGGKAHIKVAHIKHKINTSDKYEDGVLINNHNEISLNIGDEIHIHGNHWNGFSKGKNLRTNHIGLFPSFKVQDKILTAKFPTYPEVPFNFNNNNNNYKQNHV